MCTRVPAALRETLVNKWKMTGSSPPITEPRVTVRSSEKRLACTGAQHDGKNTEHTLWLLSTTGTGHCAARVNLHLTNSLFSSVFLTPAAFYLTFIHFYLSHIFSVFHTSSPPVILHRLCAAGCAGGPGREIYYLPIYIYYLDIY